MIDEKITKLLGIIETGRESSLGTIHTALLGVLMRIVYMMGGPLPAGLG